MLKLIKYLKPYLFPILLAVGLLYVQVNMDLSLPDYMSKIVNNGIQQGGIIEDKPEIIRKESVEKITALFSHENLDVIKELYTVTPRTLLKNSYNFREHEVLYLNKNITTSDSFNKEFSNFLIQVYIGDLPADFSDNFIKQTVVNITKTEYELLGANMTSIQTMYILIIGAKMLLMTLISVICTIIVGFIASKTSAGSAKSIRSDIFKKVESFSNEEFDTFSTASLITRSTNDVTQVQSLIFMFIRMVIYAPLLGIGGFVRAMGKAPSMAWLIGLAVVVLLGVIATIISISMPKFKKIQDLVDRLNLVTRENLSGLMVVRAFNRQKFEKERFDKANKDLTSTNLFVMRTMVIAMPIIMLIMNGLAVSIIWVGSKQIAIGTMQVGDMMAFIQYAMQIVMSFMMLSMVFISLPRASVSGKRIFEVLSVKPSIINDPNPLLFQNNIKGEIEFKNVSFKYPGGDVNALTDISFVAKPGTTTAIIGSTGSGKSTIVNLIPRFYDVTQGEITFDGFNIKKLDQHELRSNIGFVPQKNVLFSGTIESNLKYGKKDATLNDLKEAVNIAQAEDFISKNPESFDYEISQDGSNVSGGQRQRLSISRALMKKPSLYVFDDSFSALDFKTDSKLRKALKDSAGDSAIILVAQRVATIMNAEHIIVLDDGKIVGKGTHKELMNSCEQYNEIATSQLGVQGVL